MNNSHYLLCVRSDKCDSGLFGYSCHDGWMDTASLGQTLPMVHSRSLWILGALVYGTWLWQCFSNFVRHTPLLQILLYMHILLQWSLGWNPRSLVRLPGEANAASLRVAHHHKTVICPWRSKENWAFSWSHSNLPCNSTLMSFTPLSYLWNMLFGKENLLQVDKCSKEDAFADRKKVSSLWKIPVRICSLIFWNNLHACRTLRTWKCSDCLRTCPLSLDCCFCGLISAAVGFCFLCQFFFFPLLLALS